MRKEIIDLLESQKRFMQRLAVNPQLTEDAMKREASIDKALEHSKQQPPESDFTEKWREKLKNSVALFKIGKSPDNWFQSIVTGFREACGIIDRTEAINTDLLKACEEYSKGVLLLRECHDEITLGSALQLKKADDLGKAAIAKAKQGGE